MIHASEHGYGDIAAPDDGFRVPAGHRAWIDKALRALDEDTVEELPFAKEPAVSRFRISSPEQARWLGPGTRPFNLALAAHPDVIGRLTQSAGPVALEDLTKPPEARLSLDWRRRGGASVRLQVRDSNDNFEHGAETVFAQRVGDFIRMCATTPERGVERLLGTDEKHGLVRCKEIEAVTVGYVGREGSSIDRRRRLASVEGDDPVLLSIGGFDDRWPIVLNALRELRRLKPELLATIVPERTLRYLLEGRPFKTFAQQSKLVSLLAVEARRYLVIAGAPVPESPIGILSVFTAVSREERRCPLCEQPLPPDARPNRRLCDDCRRFGSPNDRVVGTSAPPFPEPCHGAALSTVSTP